MKKVYDKDYVESGKLREDVYWICDKYQHDFVPKSIKITFSDDFECTVPLDCSRKEKFDVVLLMRTINEFVIRKIEKHLEEVTCSKTKGGL